MRTKQRQNAKQNTPPAAQNQDSLQHSQIDRPDSAALHAPVSGGSDSAPRESMQHNPEYKQGVTGALLAWKYKQGITGALLAWKYEESVTGALLAWKYTARHNYTRHSAAPYLTTLLLLAACVLSLLAGKYPLSLEKILAGDAMQLQVLLTLRIPRTLMAVLGGFALGAAGFVFQTVFCNPLAAPDMIGVSSGASAGAAFAILFLPASAAAVTLSAFAGGLLAVGIALGLASAAGSGSIVLAGIAVHSLAQTVLMVLKLTADPERQLASIEYWIMGSLNAITLGRIPFYCAVCVIGLIGLFLLHRQIILLSVDEAEARMLGVPVGQMRLLILLLATLVVASVISVTGVISFIGLLAPHIARLLTRDNRLHTLTLSGLLGGILLTVADILARTAAASELPVSIFTSLLGAPFLLYLIMNGNGGGRHVE